MAVRRIAIVGGGMAGLAAAFELTATPELRARHRVTIYQMGWRLGGKCASGRDVQGRAIEHGLHIWFGFYENAFELLRRAYAEWHPNPGQRIRSLDQAMKPHAGAKIGYDRGEKFVTVAWPAAAGAPGMGADGLSVWGAAVHLIERVAAMAAAMGPAPGAPHPLDRHLVAEPHLRLRPAFESATGSDADWLPARLAAPGARLGALEGMRLAHRWAASIAEAPPREIARRAPDIAAHLRGVKAALPMRQGTKLAGDVAAQLVDVGIALFIGIVEDVLLGGRTLAELDLIEFRDWLVGHGAERLSAENCTMVRSLYDSMFQYVEGRLDRPDFGAGTALQVTLRMIGTYKGAFSYEAQAGFGEVVVAPIAGVLAQRGVEVRYFHQLREIGLSADRRAIAALRFGRQATPRRPNAAYRPTAFSASDGLTYWPNEPFWDQLGAGAGKPGARPDFDSYWRDRDKDEPVELLRGEDFDDAILAIPAGAFAEWDERPGACHALIAASPRFAAMVRSMRAVPSISLQLWSAKTSDDLCAGDARAMVSGPYPLNIWADMSQVLPPSKSGPRSLHLLCGTIHSDLYRRPASDARAPDEADKQARDVCLDWIEKSGGSVWPKALRADGAFDWNSLYVAQGNPAGPARFADQYCILHVDPAQCCISSAAGTARHRIKTDESGFAHLYLAGAWIDTGFNAECVEAAVMSGRQAARAICGAPARIPGEDFLHAAPGLAGLCDLLRAGIGEAMATLSAIGAAPPYRAAGPTKGRG